MLSVLGHCENVFFARRTKADFVHPLADKVETKPVGLAFFDIVAKVGWGNLGRVEELPTVLQRDGQAAVTDRARTADFTFPFPSISVLNDIRARFIHGHFNRINREFLETSVFGHGAHKVTNPSQTFIYSWKGFGFRKWRSTGARNFQRLQERRRKS